MSTTKWLAAVSALAIASAGLILCVTSAHAERCTNYGFGGRVLFIEEGTGWEVGFTSVGPVAGGRADAVNEKSGETERIGNVSGGFTSGINFSVTIQYPQGTQVYKGTVGGDAIARGYTAQEPFQGIGFHTAEPLECIGHEARLPGPEDLPPPPQQQAPPPPPPEQAPKNAITVNLTDTNGGLTVNVNNSSDVAGNCTYDATAPNSLIPPTHRDFTVGPKAGTSFQISGLRTGTQYNTVTVCRGNFQGQDVEIGRVEIAKTF